MAIDLSTLVDGVLATVQGTLRTETVTSPAGAKQAYVLEASQEPNTSQPGRVVGRSFRLIVFYLPTLGERLTIRGASAAVTAIKPTYADGVFKMATVEASG